MYGEREREKGKRGQDERCELRDDRREIKTNKRERERERGKLVTSAREETQRRPGKKGDQSFEQRKRSCYSLIMLYLWEMAFI